MTKIYKIAVILALILYFIKPSISATTAKPATSANSGFVINYVTRNICTPKPFLPKAVTEEKPDVGRIILELHTFCEVYKFPLTEAKSLWKHKAFRRDLKVVIFAAGWSTKYLNVGVIESMARPYMCRRDNNFIGMDFESYLKSINSTFTKTNHQDIAESVCQALEELVKVVPVEKIHLIGHSIGAHIVSTASRLFRIKTRKAIPRITALDPSKPCYKDYGMEYHDSKFCDVFHTNPDELGKKEPAGDVDFYFGGLEPNQLGCDNPSCSSHRAWQYYAETAYIGGTYNFQGARCRSFEELVAKNCVNNTQADVGYATKQDLRGIHVVQVNPEAPYGLNANRHSGYVKSCWKCQKG